jgi:predicted nucleic-acid-binding protein
MKSVNILVDTNVLLNDFFRRKGNINDKKRFAEASLKVASSLNRLRENNLFIASFSVMQLISLLQKNKYPLQTVKDEINYLLTKYHIITTEEKDFRTCSDSIRSMVNVDVEDNMIYCLSIKTKCYYILTFNMKDFSRYIDRRIIQPGRFIMDYT